LALAVGRQAGISSATIVVVVRASAMIGTSGFAQRA